MIKKMLVSLLCLSLLWAIAGCGSKDVGIQLLEKNAAKTSPASDDMAKNKKNIALVMKTLTNPFFIEMEKGARQAEKELNINLIVKTGAQETSIDQQIAIVEELIRDKVDAIVIAPGGSTELVPVLKKAQDANIIIVNIDNQLDQGLSAKLGLNNVPFISVDNETGAYLSARYISDMVKKPTRAAVIEGITSAKNSQDRKNGALKAFRENGNITSVVTESANWKIDEAYKLTKKLFAQYPDIGAIFCANDMMALGTIQYLKETNRGNVLVAGFDALSEAKEEIKNHRLMVTIDQQPNVQGFLGVSYAVNMINKIPVEQKQFIDVKVVTEATL